MIRVLVVRSLVVAATAAASLLLAGAPAAADTGKGSQAETIRQADWQPNGCTSPAGNSPSGVSFLDACNEHDLCYRDHYTDQWGCDWHFYEDMKTLCKTGTSGDRWGEEWCYVWARVYWLGVYSAGGFFYDTRWDPSIFVHQWPSRPGT